MAVDAAVGLISGWPISHRGDVMAAVTIGADRVWFGILSCRFVAGDMRRAVTADAAGVVFQLERPEICCCRFFMGLTEAIAIMAIRTGQIRGAVGGMGQ